MPRRSKITAPFNRDLGVTRMTVRLPPAKEEEILPILDRWAKLIPRVKG
jgi:hypothetical protein